MRLALQARARELGFDDCRITHAAPPASADHFHRWLDRGWHGEMHYLARNAEKRSDPARVLPEVRSLIVLAASYPATSQNGPPTGSGFIARYARGADYHDVLAKPLRELTQWLADAGGPDARSLWYVDTGPILERDFAQRAGVGFIGKHASLVSRRLGNWILLAEILTTLELEPDAPETNRCGTCHRCMDACPTGAIPRPFELDARRCISYLTIELKGSIPIELRPAIGNRIFGCDDCLAVCPWNRFAREGALMRAATRAELATPDLIEVLALDEPGFRKRFAGTPILRAKRRGFLRNVCVALGNTADAGALPHLHRAASNPEPLIAEHAQWAISQIKSRSEGRQPIP